MMDKLFLEDCFKLGQALRAGDADLFVSLYDELKYEDEKDLLMLKEVSRQISDLPNSLFSALKIKFSEKHFSNVEITSLPVDFKELCNTSSGHNTATSDSGVCSDGDPQDSEPRRIPSSRTKTIKPVHSTRNAIKYKARPPTEGHPRAYSSYRARRDKKTGSDSSTWDHYPRSNNYYDYTTTKPRKHEHHHYTPPAAVNDHRSQYMDKTVGAYFDHNEAVKFLQNRWSAFKQKEKTL